MSRVSKALEQHFTPDDPPPSRRFTITIHGDVYERVQEVAKRLALSWAATANLLLLPAAEDALEWIERSEFHVTHTGLSPELLQALQDGPDSPLYAEARERSGFALQEAAGLTPSGILQTVEISMADKPGDEGDTV